MRGILVVLLAAIFAAVGVFAQEKPAGEQKQEKAAAAKEDRWEGRIVRTSQDQSTLTVKSTRPAGAEKAVLYNADTKWTKMGKPAEMSEFKDGSFVICLGKYDDEGRLVASRIDLRLPR